MSSEIKAPCLKRLKRIEGQVRGLSRMVEADRYCIDIITQIAAVRAALRRVEEEVLRDHIACRHLWRQIRVAAKDRGTDGRPRPSRAVKQLVTGSSLYRTHSDDFDQDQLWRLQRDYTAKLEWFDDRLGEHS